MSLKLFIKGDGVKRGIVGQPKNFEIQIRTPTNEPILLSLNSIGVTIEGPTQLTPTLKSLLGKVEVSYVPQKSGTYFIQIILKKKNVLAKPISVSIVEPEAQSKDKENLFQTKDNNNNNNNNNSNNKIYDNHNEKKGATELALMKVLEEVEEKVKQKISSVEYQMYELNRKFEDKKDNNTLTDLVSLKKGNVSVDTHLSSVLDKLEAKLNVTEETQKRLLRMEQDFKKLEQVLSKVNLEDLALKLSRLDKLKTNTLRTSTGRSYSDIKRDLESLQKIIFDPQTPEKAREKANILLEKSIQDLEKTPEFQIELKRSQEEERRKNEPLNAAAYESLKSKLVLEQTERPLEFRKRLNKHPEFSLLFLSRDQILRKHAGDFRNFALNLTELEMRALMHVMPNFKIGQEVQLRFVQALAQKIRECGVVTCGVAARTPKSPTLRKKWKPKVGGSPGDFLRELKRQNVLS